MVVCSFEFAEDWEKKLQETVGIGCIGIWAKSVHVAEL